MSELLDQIIIPRPNGSEAFYRVAEYIKDWFIMRDIPVQVHTFTLQPYIFEISALAVLILAAIFFYLAVYKYTWLAALPVAAMGLILFLEFSLGTPVISSLISRDAENIIVAFHPEGMEQELILSAHYDTKTQVLDHVQRELVFQMILPSVGVGVLLAMLWWGLHYRGRRPRKLLAASGLGLMVLALAYWVLLAFTFGGGFMARPSPGAVDDGAAVAVLMELAGQVEEMALEKTGVTIILFAGEEIGCQGARAYLRDQPRSGDIPAYNVNLELLCQDGPYIYWAEDGVFTTRYATCPELNSILGKAVQTVASEEIRPLYGEFTTISDSGVFLAAGIPSTTLGNYGCEERGIRFFHTHHDNRDRIVEERIPEAIAILAELIGMFEGGALAARTTS